MNWAAPRFSHCGPGLRLLVLVLMLYACSTPPPEASHKTRLVALGTMVDVDLWGVDDQQAATAVQAVQTELDRIYQTWHAWHPSTLTDINRQLAAGDTVSVDKATLAVLTKARRLSIDSGNLFNPAIGRLIALWGFQSDERPQDRPPPEPGAIERLLAKPPTMEDLIINQQTLRSKNPALQIDLGGFAKGYAVDRAIERLQLLGIHNAIVNAGGDLRAIGRHGERPWHIGIRHPRKPGIIAAVDVQGDESVFTSGNYERFFDYQGVRYHHIIDPRNGYPARGTLSVTVIHPDAGTADAAATALFVAGPKGWLQVARRMGLKQVMLIDSEMRVHITPAMRKRVFFKAKKRPEIIVSTP